MMKPRHFSLKPIYADEHKERVEAAKQRALQAAAGQADTPPQAIHFKRPRQRSHPTLSTPMLLSMLILITATLLLIALS